MIDLIGLGALNLDVIVSSTGRASLPQSVAGEIAVHFGQESERPASREEIFPLIEKVESHATVCLGGSSFNTIKTVTAITDTVSLGFVGSLGTLPVDLPEGETSFEAWFKSNRIDDRFVRRIPDELPGIAVSLMRQGDRQLLTHAGANDRFAETVARFGFSLIDYISKARVLHVTSLFDDYSANALGEILAWVRRKNPTILISFDPGHHWVHNPTPEILALYSFADFLFLNDRECRELGGGYNSDRLMAERILREVVGHDCFVFVKRPHEIVVFTNLAGAVNETYFRNAVLSDEEIEDATGAGDIFAGGVLVAWLVGVGSLTVSVEFALELVRAKLIGRTSELARGLREAMLKNTCLSKAVSDYRTDFNKPSQISDQRGLWKSLLVG